MLSRRGLLLGALAAPAVVRAASLMVIRKPLVLPPQIGRLRMYGPEILHDIPLRTGDVLDHSNGRYSVKLPPMVGDMVVVRVELDGRLPLIQQLETWESHGRQNVTEHPSILMLRTEQ